MNRYEKMLQLDPGLIPLPHGERCRRMFDDIINGFTCAYLQMEDPALMEGISRENAAAPGEIRFSVLSDGIIAYDALFFRNWERSERPAYMAGYRPYFISFIISGQDTDPKQLETLRSGWYKCVSVGPEAETDEDGIVLTGTLVTSASPVNIMKGFRLKFINDTLDPKVLDMINNVYNPASLPIHPNVQQVLDDAWDESWLRTVDFYNVGKGNADYIRGSRNRILYDIGYDQSHRKPQEVAKKDEFSRAVAALRNLQPQCVILSHWDMDHYIGCAYAPQRIFSVKWIAPTLGKNASPNACRLALYLDVFGNLCLVDRRQPRKLVAEVKGRRTDIRLWLGEGGHKGITEQNCLGLMLELRDHRTSKTFLLAGDVPYVCMPNALLAKKIDFLHVPHHCSKMNLGPIQAPGYQPGTFAIITTRRNDAKLSCDHFDALLQKYDAVYFTTERINAAPGDTLGKQIRYPFDTMTER